MRADVSAKHCNWSPSRPYAWVRPCALLSDQLYERVELAVKGLSVAALSEYTEGSDCSVYRDTVRLKGGPGLRQSERYLDRVGQPPLIPPLQRHSQDKYDLEQQRWVV